MLNEFEALKFVRLDFGGSWIRRLMPDGVVTSTNSDTEESDAQSRIMDRPATGIWPKAISDKRISMVSIIIPRPVTCQAQRMADRGKRLAVSGLRAAQRNRKLCI